MARRPRPKSPFEELKDGSSFVEMIEAGIPEPDMLIYELVYDGGSHWLSGHPKSGKSIIAMHFGHEVMCAGRYVIWLDYEGGEARMARRLDQMGIKHDLIARYFKYGYRLPIGPEPELRDQLETLIKDHTTRAGTPLVVLDSQAKALSAAGLDENSASEVTAWTTGVILPLCNELNTTVLVIDHEAKASTGTSQYSRGSGAKAADADVSFYVEKVQDQHGRQKKDAQLNYNSWCIVKLRIRHDRDGFLPDDDDEDEESGLVAFQIGEGNGSGRLPVLLSSLPGKTTVKERTKTDTLNALNRHPDGLSYGDLRNETGATDKMQSAALHELASEKKVAKGEGHLDPWRSLEPRL